MGKVLVSIIIPVYNEEKTLPEVIKRLLALELNKELIFIDDGSKDGSSVILGSINSSCVKVFRHESNKGKGSAIRTGIKNSSGDIVIIQDADLEYNPDEIAGVISPIISDGCDAVFGSRFLKKNPVIYRSFYFGNKLISIIISIIARKKTTDAYTCYKAFNKKYLENKLLFSSGFEIESELRMIALTGGAVFKEVPISYSPRKVAEGKKIKPGDFFTGVLTALKFFHPRRGRIDSA